MRHCRIVLLSLAEIEHAIRASWSLASCDPSDAHLWSDATPARGQCGVTALVVHDLLGGDLLKAEVRHADGSRQGVHYWNRLPGGVELDLTREQFTDSEAIGDPTPVARPAGPFEGRLGEQYQALAAAVHERLGGATAHRQA